jgi:hypothetical protein
MFVGAGPMGYAIGHPLFPLMKQYTNLDHYLGYEIIINYHFMFLFLLVNLVVVVFHLD